MIIYVSTYTLSHQLILPSIFPPPMMNHRSDTISLEIQQFVRRLHEHTQIQLKIIHPLIWVLELLSTLHPLPRCLIRTIPHTPNTLLVQIIEHTLYPTDIRPLQLELEQHLHKVIWIHTLVHTIISKIHHTVPCLDHSLF